MGFYSGSLFASPLRGFYFPEDFIWRGGGGGSFTVCSYSLSVRLEFIRLYFYLKRQFLNHHIIPFNLQCFFESLGNHLSNFPFLPVSSGIKF